jgi:hypothetical protein
VAPLRGLAVSLPASPTGLPATTCRGTAPGPTRLATALRLATTALRSTGTPTGRTVVTALRLSLRLATLPATVPTGLSALPALLGAGSGVGLPILATLPLSALSTGAGTETTACRRAATGAKAACRGTTAETTLPAIGLATETARLPRLKRTLPGLARLIAVGVKDAIDFGILGVVLLLPHKNAEGLAVKFHRVADAKHTNAMGDGRKFGIADFNRLLIGVGDIDGVFTNHAFHRPVQNFKLQHRQHAGLGLVLTRSTFDDMDQVAKLVGGDRKRLATRQVRLDVGEVGVKLHSLHV